MVCCVRADFGELAAAVRVLVKQSKKRNGAPASPVDGLRGKKAADQEPCNSLKGKMERKAGGRRHVAAVQMMFPHRVWSRQDARLDPIRRQP